ncbi:MAG: DUF4954 family protein [Treponema sp.]|jgi:NDP-sugar pyrophosphorylase family protein|nr:DUF4954 family protein [Treponema sp.]
MTAYIESTKRYGYDFIPGEYLPAGEDEYYLRNQQLDELYTKTPREGVRCSVRRGGSYRHLTPEEIRALEQNGNVSANWQDVFVSGEFNPGSVKNCFFAGLVRLGAIGSGLLRFHDYVLPEGLTNSRVISSDIGDHCAVYDCGYLSHYIIGDGVLLSSVREMDTTNHSKFGEGILKDGEDESVRVWIEPLNEAGGRAVLPFADMIPADAYLWAVYRDDRALMDAFNRITQAGSDSRRGCYGVIGHGTVIKHCQTIKDVKVGNAAYIKGANKLKNLTVKSDKQEPTQIGEGVELVNGIVGYGCHVFYGCKAVRFVLGNNCNLKYGARLINSILGDNSTVSCCEMLHNLVFPAHEQHHNNSFLIAAMIMGQSNMAAGATVGSNHNSRGNDGEIIAGRGFWPGLSSTLKHNCRFASYTLIAKGNYPAELDIPLPFSLLTTDIANTRRELMPAYWWMYNMYALERNSWKSRARDKRAFKPQRYETDYLAPDTAAEIIRGLDLLARWEEEGGTGRALERSRQPVRILKAEQGRAAYREMLAYYAVKTLAEYIAQTGAPFLSFQAAHPEAASLAWVNLGGQLAPEGKADALRQAVREGRLASWAAIHAEYEQFRREYSLDRALNALQVLRFLQTGKAGAAGAEAVVTAAQWKAYLDEGARLRRYIEEQVYKTKNKDYADPFRNITYRNAQERDAVLGRMEENAFVKTVKEESGKFFETLLKAAQG